MDPSRLANAMHFDEDLADEVLRSNDDDLFMVAIARPDCPVGLLVDLSLAIAPRVRRAVAGHPNTAMTTLRRMAQDDDIEVARIAKARLQ